MSVCGNCSYPYEAMLADPSLTEEDACGTWCSHEDAAHRMQWAYNQLYERYEELEKENKELKERNNRLVSDMNMVYEVICGKDEGVPLI